jgi:hypothetical protein
VAEVNTPLLMDAAGRCLLYYEIRQNVYRVAYFQILQVVVVLKPLAMIVTIVTPSKWIKLKESPHEEV